MTSLDQGTAVTRDYFITVWMSKGLVWVAETAFIWNFLRNHHLPCPSFSLHVCTNAYHLILCSASVPYLLKIPEWVVVKSRLPRPTLLFTHTAWAEQKCTHRRLRLPGVLRWLFLFFFFFSFPQITKHQDVCGGCIPGTFGDWLLLGLLIVCCGKKINVKNCGCGLEV